MQGRDQPRVLLSFLGGMSTPALQDRPVSKTQVFCSNLPWSVNGKMLRQAFEVRRRPRLRLPGPWPSAPPCTSGVAFVSQCSPG